MLAGLAALFGRPDAAVLATPLLIVAIWGAVTRPSAAPTATVSLDHRTLREGEATTLRVQAEAPGADRVIVRLVAGDGWATRPARGVVAAPVRSHGPATVVPIVIDADRWGSRQVGPVTVVVDGAWGAFRVEPRSLSAGDLTTLPLPAVFDNTAAIPNPAGLVGAHRSRRIGDGAEFASIRPFTVGDRLRRIHWPVTLRTGELHVSASNVDVDSEVAIVIDATDDVGEHGPLDGTASSLDRSVRAAGAIAEHFLRHGDRVGLRTSGAARTVRLPANAGRAHLRRVLYELALVQTGAGRERRAAPRELGLGSRALVVVLTPLLSTAAVEQVAFLAARHPGIIVIDTLPDNIARQRHDERDLELAWRIRLLERDSDIARLRSRGVPVVPWQGPGSLDQVLRDLHRPARAPRVGVRRSATSTARPAGSPRGRGRTCWCA